jgi:glycine cleavage system H protein
MDPKDYKYTKEHEWVRIEGDLATVGITNWAQEQLGDIVSVELPKIGKKISTLESVALIDSMKTTSDVYAPISGEIADVNQKLEDSPELLNEDPYGEGWILRIKIKDPKELEGMLTFDGYEEFLKTEGEA